MCKILKLYRFCQMNYTELQITFNLALLNNTFLKHKMLLIIYNYI